MIKIQYNSSSLAVFCFFLFAFTISACECCEDDKPDPEFAEVVDGIRIAWDYKTLTRIAPKPDRSAGYFGYARMIQLHDGKLVCVYETSSRNVELTTSTDMGENWDWPTVIFFPINDFTMAVPSVIELSDHSILVACNPRPTEPYSLERKFGIRVRKSIDGGETWTPVKVIYEAQSIFQDGCWEPAFLQLPDGEVQLYFSNEGIYTESDEQNISLFRSYDSGDTWTAEPEIIGYRKSRRDGMPVPLLLEDKGEILVSIEDNKAGQFKPSIFHEKVVNNWSDGYIDANDPRRSYQPFDDPLPIDIYAGGPYLARLQTGEVLLSYQTTLDRNNAWNYSSMAVEIGDDSGTIFSRRSIPFSVPISKWGLWNSLAVIGENIPVAITSTNAFSNSSTEVWMIKGHIIPEVEVPVGTPDIDGQLSDECWNGSWPYFIGSLGPINLRARFCADNQNLYLAVQVNDEGGLPIPDGTNERIVFQLDTQRKGSHTPGADNYAIHMSQDGTILVQEGDNGEWVPRENVSGMQSEYYLSDKNFQIELSIPWSFSGLIPSTGQRMGVNFILKHYPADKDPIDENISSNDPMNPSSWCPVSFISLK